MIRILITVLVLAAPLANAQSPTCPSLKGKPNICPNRAVVTGSSLELIVKAPKEQARCSKNTQGLFECKSKEEQDAINSQNVLDEDDWKLFYTLDGSEPDTNSPSIQASSPLRLQPKEGRPALTVRVIAQAPDGALSRVNTSTYIFVNQLDLQSATAKNLPKEWGDKTIGKTSAHYKFDAAYLSQMAPNLTASFASIPSISIVASDEDLFSQECGIYANPEAANGGEIASDKCSKYRSWGKDQWERLVSIEWIDGHLKNPTILPPDHEFDSKHEQGFQVDCSLKIQGGSSQRDWKTRKLSMQVGFSERFGEKSLEYPIFEDATAVSKFKTLVLDAHLNYTFTHPLDEQAYKASYWSDALVSDIFHKMGDPAPHHRFVHLFLGGMYWGLYDLHEKPNEDFAADYFGGKSKDFDVYKSQEELDAGQTEAWDLIWDSNDDLHLDANLANLNTVVDIEAYTRYMLVNIWVANTDWPHNNYYAIYNRADPNLRWRFVSWDAERSFDNYRADIVKGLDGRGIQVHSPGDLFKDLMTNKTYRESIRNQFASMSTNDGVFASHNMQDLYMRRYQEIKDAMVWEAARWASEKGRDPAGLLTAWYKNNEDIYQSFLTQRTKYVANQLNK